jgi:hypothetical protein
MGMIPSVIAGCPGMLGAGHDASVTVWLSSRGAAGGRRFRLLVVLMEAEERVAAPWGGPIGAFGCAGRLSVTEAQSGGQLRLQLGKPGKIGLAIVTWLFTTFLSLLVMSPGMRWK